MEASLENTKASVLKLAELVLGMVKVYVEVRGMSMQIAKGNFVATMSIIEFLEEKGVISINQKKMDKVLKREKL